jgi:hypothetical protein
VRQRQISVSTDIRYDEDRRVEGWRSLRAAGGQNDAMTIDMDMVDMDMVDPG